MTGAAAGANPWTHGSNPLNKIKFVKSCALFETWQWGIAVLDVYCPTHESCISLEGWMQSCQGPSNQEQFGREAAKGLQLGLAVQLALAVHLAVHLAVGLQCAALQNHHLGLSEWENCYIGVRRSTSSWTRRAGNYKGKIASLTDRSLFLMDVKWSI